MSDFIEDIYIYYIEEAQLSVSVKYNFEIVDSGWTNLTFEVFYKNVDITWTFQNFAEQIYKDIQRELEQQCDQDCIDYKESLKY